ncbi:PleD family two-component system response regulator [Nocardioides sp.]|uniref:response regulator n=1 Tax=Nocardioides sp. TaxID=35761 RepID=UPI003566EAF7
MARILVADTDKSVRDFVRLRLSAWGHQIVPYADGASALQAWRDEQFDVVLLDLDLPRLTGLEVLRAIRSSDRLDRPSVVMMAQHSQRAEAAAAFELGADEFVFKPFTLGFMSSFAGFLFNTDESEPTRLAV